MSGAGVVALGAANAAWAQDAMMVCGILLTLLGVKLGWTAPRRRMSIEERAKDGRLTVAQARRQLQVLGWRAPLLTLIGMAFLTVAVLR